MPAKLDSVAATRSRTVRTCSLAALYFLPGVQLLDRGRRQFASAAAARPTVSVKQEYRDIYLDLRAIRN